MEIKNVATVVKIAMTLISLFSLNDMQAKEIETYAKEKANAWIIERKREDEIEAYIRNKIYEIK